MVLQFTAAEFHSSVGETFAIQGSSALRVLKKSIATFVGKTFVAYWQSMKTTKILYYGKVVTYSYVLGNFQGEKFSRI